MAVIEIARIQVRRGQENQTGMPQLDSGEFGWAEDTENLYIGKRIADGAVDDTNTRILTENDLTNIFAFISSTSTSAVYYKYRADVSYINAVSQSVQKKLDDQFPSLTDYGVVAQSTGTDITAAFAAAIADIFYNSGPTSNARKDARRTLKIPAGSYVVSNLISLPPYTKIVGEGHGLTTITVTSPNGLFKTVDADGNDYDSLNMQTSLKPARDVHIEGMTIQFTATLAINTGSSLIRLDNVTDARVKDCVLAIGNFDWDSNVTTSTYNSASAIGISIRGNYGSGVVGDTVPCKNVYIENCKFSNIGTGTYIAGTVVRPVITDNVYNRCIRGIIVEAGNAYQGPSNGTITDNRFQNIEQQAILIKGYNTDQRSNFLSSNNYFINVGNGDVTQLSVDNISGRVGTVADSTSTIFFGPAGNKTVNDYFHRRDVANATTNTDFYYSPLVVGSTSIDDDSTYTKNINTASSLSISSSTSITKFPVTGGDQYIKVRYLLTGTNWVTRLKSGLHRKGELDINLTNAGNSQITDSYNYIDTLDEVSTGTIFATTATAQFPQVIMGQNIFAVNVTTYPKYNSTNLDPADGTWFLTGTDPSNPYFGYSAQIIGRVANSVLFNNSSVFDTNWNLFATDSAFPSFDFNRNLGTITWSLLRANSSAIQFNTSLSTNSSYVNLIATNDSTSTIYTLEYQVNIVQ
jgi:hypothetical protein